MFLTNILLKKAKAKKVMVVMESMVSKYTFNCIRPRLAEKLEFIAFDPYVRMESVFREKKKLRSIH